MLGSMTLDPIAPVRPPNINISSMSVLGLGGGSALTVTSLPPLGLGGAPFSTQYNPSPDDESTLPVQAILRRALSLGINLIDTSPYYGNSEIILGKALRAVWREGWDRQGMFICTKVGRVKLDEFDYRPESVRRSVERSFERLGVGVLDVVYCHDVEFVTTGEVLGAVCELFKFKDEGKVRYVGISGMGIVRV
jgi:D-arabinose 1-dehydrogenase